MKSIAQLVVHVFDLIEAEGASLLQVVRAEARGVQAATAHLALGAACLCVSAPLLVGGVGLMATGLMWRLETIVDPSLAAGLTGLAVMLVGGGFVACFRALTAQGKR